jgi:23S rRNA (uracil1939-C5)-methyltransferase
VTSIDVLPDGCVPACHGCRHRSLGFDESLAQKMGYLARALGPWSGVLTPVVEAEPAHRLAYRDRVTLSSRWQALSGWQFGLMRRDELIAIHDCPVHTPRIRSLVHALAAALPGHAELPLAYLHVSGAQATLIVKARRIDRSLLERSVPSVLACGVEGYWLHLHPSAGRRLFARSGWTLIDGKAESRGPLGLLHGPTAFLQALPGLHARALAEAAAHLGPGQDVSVLDLYCGLGASLREWTEAGSLALGIELSGEAVGLAARNAPRASVLRGTCQARLPQVRAWWSEQPGERVAYVNPPRSGLEPAVIAALAGELRPNRLAYLSCSAGTLARDLAQFQASGYHVQSLRAYDFFPNTHHVEVLALLARGAAARVPLSRVRT